MLLTKKTQSLIGLTVWLAFSLFPLAGFAQQEKNKQSVTAEGQPILWQEPTDIATRDLRLGPGGAAMQPDLSQVTYLETQRGGASTKYRVRDGAGKEWVAKVGAEAKSEIAAGRLLWAVGYFTDIAYFVPFVEIKGKGKFVNVRFEARPENIERLGEWKWDQNPFRGTPEFQGLKVMMLLVNNWDIKDSNNQMLKVRDESTGQAQIRYVVSDLGGTFGTTSGLFFGTRNQPEVFAKTKFIGQVKNDLLEFKYSGKRKDLFRDITTAHAQWIANWLSRLSDQQVKDAFHAANYMPGEVELLAGVIRARITELTTLAAKQPPTE